MKHKEIRIKVITEFRIKKFNIHIIHVECIEALLIYKISNVLLVYLVLAILPFKMVLWKQVSILFDKNEYF